MKLGTIFAKQDRARELPEKGTFFAKSNANKGEMYIYDEISRWGISAQSFQKELNALGSVSRLDVYMNSPGGSVFDGIAIFNQLARHPATEKVVHVDGIAASIASVIMMAGTEIKIASNGTVMIHNPWAFAIGTAADMRKMADSLDLTRGQILDTYVKRTKGDAKEIGAWMDDETWMSADEAKKRGFADTITDAVEMEASFPLLESFAKVPANLRGDVADRGAQFDRLASRHEARNLRASPRPA